MDDTIYRQAAIEALRDYLVGKRCPDDGTLTCRLIENEVINKLPFAELGTNLAEVGTDVTDINKFIDSLEEIFADIRESHVDDSVCGLCEYDGAYIGQSGDWCNECPGFDKEDCFKLSDKCRKRWLKSVKLPPTEPKRGKWILDRSGAYCCSECMEPCASYVMMKPRDKFCKMCGAKMEVTE